MIIRIAHALTSLEVGVFFACQLSNELTRLSRSSHIMPQTAARYTSVSCGCARPLRCACVWLRHCCPSFTLRYVFFGSRIVGSAEQMRHSMWSSRADSELPYSLTEPKARGAPITRLNSGKLMCRSA